MLLRSGVIAQTCGSASTTRKNAIITLMPPRPRPRLVPPARALIQRFLPRAPRKGTPCFQAKRSSAQPQTSTVVIVDFFCISPARRQGSSSVFPSVCFASTKTFTLPKKYRSVVISTKRFWRRRVPGNLVCGDVSTRRTNAYVIYSMREPDVYMMVPSDACRHSMLSCMGPTVPSMPLLYAPAPHSNRRKRETITTATYNNPTWY